MKKLKSIGLRPISALVDITNYVMFDQNRPLHVYDADQVKGKIIVRSAQDGESFKALDEKTYDLKKGMCTISDEEKVLGLGGIMGGESTGCNFDTINVLLESALFDNVNTARTGILYFYQTGSESDQILNTEYGSDQILKTGSGTGLDYISKTGSGSDFISKTGPGSPNTPKSGTPI